MIRPKQKRNLWRGSLQACQPQPALLEEPMGTRLCNLKNGRSRPRTAVLSPLIEKRPDDNSDQVSSAIQIPGGLRV